MKLEEIRKVVIDCYASQLGGMEVDDDLDLIENGIIDSLALVNLVLALEEAVPSLTIPDSDATQLNLGSVSRIADYMQSRDIAS